MWNWVVRQYGVVLEESGSSGVRHSPSVRGDIPANLSGSSFSSRSHGLIIDRQLSGALVSRSSSRVCLESLIAFFLSESGNDGYKCFSNGGRAADIVNGVF